MKKGNYFSTVLIVSVVAVLILLLAVGFTGNVILKSSFLKNKNGGSRGSSTIQPVSSPVVSDSVSDECVGGGCEFNPAVDSVSSSLPPQPVSSPVVSDVTSEECVGGGCEFNLVGEDSASDSLPSVDVAAQEAECVQSCESNKAATFPGCRNTLVSRFASLFGTNIQILFNAGTSCASLSCSAYCSARTVGDNTVRTRGAVVGEWTNDLEAAKALAREKNSFVIITFSSTGCSFCHTLETGVYGKKYFSGFQDWTKENNIALVFSTTEKTRELQDLIYNLYLKDLGSSIGLPYVIIIDGNGTMLGRFAGRSGRDINGIHLYPNPQTFSQVVKSFIPCTFSIDADGDGYGGAFGKFIINRTNCMPFKFTEEYVFGDHISNKMSCQCGAIPVGYVNNSLDCNDTNMAVNPDAKEICRDYIDNDCNGYRDFNYRMILDPALFVDEKYGKIVPARQVQNFDGTGFDKIIAHQGVMDCYGNYSY